MSYNWDKDREQRLAPKYHAVSQIACSEKQQSGLRFRQMTISTKPRIDHGMTHYPHSCASCRSPPQTSCTMKDYGWQALGGQWTELPIQCDPYVVNFQQILNETLVSYKTTTPFQKPLEISDLYYALDTSYAKKAGLKVTDGYSVMQALYNAGLADISYVDNSHFRPFVYEQLNDLLLNQLCP